MRKILSFLTALVAVAGLSSCQLDKEQDYTFSYQWQRDLEGEENEKAFDEYMKETFSSPGRTSSYFGYYADAYNQAIEFFSENFTAKDQETLFSYIKNEKDVIYFYWYMTSADGKNQGPLYAWLFNQETKKNYEEAKQKEEGGDPGQQPAS